MASRSKAVAETLCQLKEKSFESLTALPSYQETKKPGKFTVAIWIDKTDESDVRVVVQGYQRKMLGMGMMCADGFHKDRDGVITPLVADEISEFM